MSLRFEDDTDAIAPAAPLRADVACFIGHVARRAGTPLPPAQRTGLREAGWLGGPWVLAFGRIEALEQLPVVVESWAAFEQVFETRSRLVVEGGSARGAGWLAAAVRAFFAAGGRRAIVIRVADPWPMVETTAATPAERARRLQRLLPLWSEPGVTGTPIDVMDPPSWRGIAHLHGLAETSMVCLPDLPELCATVPPPLRTERELPPPAEGFTECSAEPPQPRADDAARHVAAPRVDAEGLQRWARAVGLVRDLLAGARRDCLFVGALPLLLPETPLAVVDPLAWLLRQQALVPDRRDGGGDATGASSAFVQLAAPWTRTRSSDDLPERLAPPDGLLAGLLAANALARGTFRSAAGVLLPEVVALEPQPALVLDDDGPWTRLAGRVCLIAPQPDGMALQSDVTTSPDRAWRGGAVSRMLASLLRAARRIGEPLVFEASGPLLWARLTRSIEALLADYWVAGGLGGSSSAEAYRVRCDRSTMSQADLDAGRAIVQIEVLPVAAVDRIVVRLALGALDRSPALEGV